MSGRGHDPARADDGLDVAEEGARLLDAQLRIQLDDCRAPRFRQVQAHRGTTRVGLENATQIGEELGCAPRGGQAQVERQVRPTRQIQEGHRLAIDGHALLTHVHLALDLDDDVLGEVGLNRLVGTREEEHVHRTRQVLDRRNRPRVTLLRHLRRQ